MGRKHGYQNCVCCGKLIHNETEGVRLALADRGGLHAWLCIPCARRERGYSEENMVRYGVGKVHEFTFSKELETSHSSRSARIELLHFGFIPTSDVTVDVEYKSPIYEGLCALSKQCVTIEKMMAEGNLGMAENCGTHLHVGHPQINPTTARYLRRFNNSLFVPLSNAIMADVEKSARFFGRRPNSWAQPITMDDPSGNVSGYEMKHSAMFNLQHDYTIEFRQAKFVNAKQYMQVAKFAKDCANAIIENFIKHFNDETFDTRRYVNRTEYRKHKADVTANKLVKLYEKYTANI